MGNLQCFHWQELHAHSHRLLVLYRHTLDIRYQALDSRHEGADHPEKRAQHERKQGGSCCQKHHGCTAYHGNPPSRACSCGCTLE